MKFRKKPVVIEAVQWTTWNEYEIADFIPADKFSISDSGAKLFIDTLEGQMTAECLDWIIKGVKGEFYPCKPDIFAATYESAESASAPDRAEELARDRNWLKIEAQKIFYAYQCSRDAGADAVASLLRREMGRWIPVSERLPDTNEAGVSSVFFWVTSEDGWQFGYYRKDAEGECWESERSDAYNEPYTYSTEQVSYWLPESALPAPPREEG